MHTPPAGCVGWAQPPDSPATLVQFSVVPPPLPTPPPRPPNPPPPPPSPPPPP
eukprot:COSAG01_NODE_67814_length_266_cov_0.532934_1_plen_52_part_10